MAMFTADLWVNDPRLGPVVSSGVVLKAEARDEAIQEADEWAETQLDQIAGATTLKMSEDGQTVHANELLGRA